MNAVGHEGLAIDFDSLGMSGKAQIGGSSNIQVMHSIDDHFRTWWGL